MKAVTLSLCFSLLVVVGYAYAQRFPTNNVTQAQAVKIASRLRVGMSEQTATKILQEQNHLKSGGDVVVGPGSPSTRFYLLSDGCSLDVEIEPRQGQSNRWVSAASIQSNGVKIVSIVLTNAH